MLAYNVFLSLFFVESELISEKSLLFSIFIDLFSPKLDIEFVIMWVLLCSSILSELPDNIDVPDIN